MPSPRLPGLNGLKLQFHWVPCSLEIVSVPLGACAELPFPELAPGDPEDGVELQAATAARKSAAVPATRRRLIGSCPPLGGMERPLWDFIRGMTLLSGSMGG